MKMFLQSILAFFAFSCVGSLWAQSTPIAVWTNFRNADGSLNLTAQGLPYTLSNDGACTVDENGYLEIKGGGVSLSSDLSISAFSLLIDVVSVPMTDADSPAMGTLATFNFGNNVANYSTDGSNLYVGYGANKKNHSSEVTFTGGLLMMTYYYASNTGTDGYYKVGSAETVHIAAANIKSSNDKNVTGFRIGAYDAAGTAGATAAISDPLVGMKVRAIYLYDTRWTTLPSGEYLTIPQVVWAGTTSEGSNSGTWDNQTDNTPWRQGTNAVAFVAGEAVTFGDITDAASATVTVGESVAPAAITVDNAATSYEIGSETYTIVGNHPIIKRGGGALTLIAPELPTGNAVETTTRISELIQEGGEVTLQGDALLATQTHANKPVGSKLTIKGGTLDLNGAHAYNSAYWLTDYTITLGGAKAPAEIKDTATTKTGVVLYTNRDLIHYVGTYVDANGDTQLSPAATFGVNYWGSYAGTNNNNVTVEAGAGSAEGGVGYDLDITGELGHASGRSDVTTLVKKGAGVLRLSGTNTLAGLTIEAGKVLVNKTDALSGKITIASGATLDLGGNNNLTIETLSGAGTVRSSTPITLEVGRFDNFTGTFENVSLTLDADDYADRLEDVTVDFPDGAQVTVKHVEKYSWISWDETTKTLKVELAKLPPKMTWMPIGDSITEGEYDLETNGGYRLPMWKTLRKAGLNVHSVGFRTGHNGGAPDNPETTPWAAHNGIYNATISSETGSTSSAYQAMNLETQLEVCGYPDVITVLLGVNDINCAEGDAIANRAQLAFDAWVDYVERIATLRPESIVVVSTLLPVTKAAIKEDVASFNTKVKNAWDYDEAPFTDKTPNVTFVDLNTIEGLNPATGYDYKDQFHPNAAGSKKVGEAFGAAVVAAYDAKFTAESSPKIVRVHNEADGLHVLFDRPIASIGEVSATLGAVQLGDVTHTSNARVVVIEVPDEVVLTKDTLTLSGTITPVIGSVAESVESTNKTTIEFIGATTEENVPSAYIGNLKKRQTITLTPDGEIETTPHGTALSNVTRVGYYVEVKRRGQPAQFVWVAMDAFDASEAGVSLPSVEGKGHKERVSNLAVYGNRGNFAKAIMGGEGIIEFTPWNWTAADEGDFPADACAEKYGWNDTVDCTEGTTLRGCMQVARIRTAKELETLGASNQEAVEMLFAFNGFLSTTESIDLGIGSVNTNRRDPSMKSSPELWSFDWTGITDSFMYDALSIGEYDSVRVEVWMDDGVTFSNLNDAAITDVVEIQESHPEICIPVGNGLGTEDWVRLKSVSLVMSPTSNNKTKYMYFGNATEDLTATQQADGMSDAVEMGAIHPVVNKSVLTYNFSQSIYLKVGETYPLTMIYDEDSTPRPRPYMANNKGVNLAGIVDTDAIVTLTSLSGNAATTNNQISGMAPLYTVEVDTVPSYVWLGTSSATWSDADNWQTGTVPPSNVDSQIIFSKEAKYTTITIPSEYTRIADALVEGGTYTFVEDFSAAVTVASGATLNVDVLSGKQIDIKAGGYLKYMYADNITNSDLAGITGDGTLEFCNTNNKYYQLKPNAIFASSLSLVNNATGGLLLTMGDWYASAANSTSGRKLAFRNLSGTGKFRNDNGGDTRGITIEITQDMPTIYTGIFDYNGTSNRDFNVVIVGADEEKDTTLTLAGTHTTHGTLTVTPNANVNLTGTWEGSLNVQGSISGTGRVATESNKTVTFADGSWIDATDGMLTAVGAVTQSGSLKVALPIMAATKTEATSYKVLALPSDTITEANVKAYVGSLSLADTTATVEDNVLTVTTAATETPALPAQTTLPEGASAGTQSEVLTEQVLQAIVKKLPDAVTKVTSVVVQGAKSIGTGDDVKPTVLATHSAEAIEVFENILEVVTSEVNDGTGTATIAYDFGITKMTIDANENVILTVTVQNTFAEGETNTAAIAKDVILKVFDADAVEGVDPLVEKRVTTAASEVEISIPFATFDEVKAHKLKVEAVK